MYFIFIYIKPFNTCMYLYYHTYSNELSWFHFEESNWVTAGGYVSIWIQLYLQPSALTDVILVLIYYEKVTLYNSILNNGRKFILHFTSFLMLRAKTSFKIDSLFCEKLYRTGKEEYLQTIKWCYMQYILLSTSMFEIYLIWR